ncbi:MAG TPA: alginate export family protein, partial [Terriglobales bacterium]|nr:alginate export family protein [Terriglobales bacterium]
LYSTASTALAKSAAGTAGRFVGQEIDFVAAYNYNKRTQLAGGFGHLFPGTFLNRTTPGNGYTYPYLAMTYGF